ncbi:hypothetical protein M9Y10_019879 [Tritrichomonas musculus]|uniref:F5/8 type C domain-containing protein n=1 Tax=Tritrichomonas musculus TaxID=1915356 RepID=A0ABR2HJL4_9EUKA
MRSNNNSDGLSNPKSWIIEVSNDGKKWDEIDRQENSSSLKGSKIECEFKVKQTNKGFYRYIRLHQTGPGWGQNSGRIWFCKMELYGSLKYLSK